MSLECFGEAAAPLQRRVLLRHLDTAGQNSCCVSVCVVCVLQEGVALHGKEGGEIVEQRLLSSCMDA